MKKLNPNPKTNETRSTKHNNWDCKKTEKIETFLLKPHEFERKNWKTLAGSKSIFSGKMEEVGN